MKEVSRRTGNQLSNRTVLKICLRVFNISPLMLAFFVFSHPETSSAAVPNAPSGLSATPISLTQIRLDWVDNSSDENSFCIERLSGSTYINSGLVLSNVATYTVGGLTPNTTYTFRVRARNSSGYYSAFSNEASATTLKVNEPSSLTLSSATYTSATLNWNDNSNNETGFKLERKTGSGNYYTIAYPGENATTYTNAGLTAGMECYYRIRACNGTYCSDYSNELKLITPVVKAPSDLTATPVSLTQIRLDWADNSSDEKYYYIERINGYTYSVGTNVTTYTYGGLMANTTYTFRVRAYNSSGGGYSTYSNEATATTLTLNAPSDLTASPLSDKQVKLAWTDNSSDETQFHIQYRAESSETYSDLPPVSTNITTYTHVSVSPNTKYYYRVRAYDGYNYSSYSNEANATTPSCVQEGFYQP